LSAKASKASSLFLAVLFSSICILIASFAFAILLSNKLFSMSKACCAAAVLSSIDFEVSVAINLNSSIFAFDVAVSTLNSLLLSLNS